MLAFLRFLMTLCFTLSVQGSPLRQAPIQFTANPTTVKPGQTVTLAWSVPDSFAHLDHVTLEMGHPSQADRLVFPDLPVSGAYTVTIPLDYYDVADFWLFPEQAGGVRYLEENGAASSAALEIAVDDGVEVTKLRADPNPTPHASGVLISYEVSGLGPDSTPVYFWYYGEDGIYTRTGDLPPVGTLVLEPPPYYTETFTVFLHADKVWTGNRLEIGIVCPFDDYLAPTCPFTHEQETLRVQPFEHGWMISRNGRALILDESGYFYERAPYDDDPSGTDLIPPDGLQLPDSEFVGIWSRYTLVDSLGWATAPERTYTTMFETAPDTAGRHRVTGYYFVLPDGQTIHANPMTMYWQAVE